MSDILSSDVKKSMEQPEHDLSKAMGQLTVTTDDSDKTSPSLSDMPIDVVGPIIKKLDYRHQLRLRKVSKSLHALVDKQKPACKRIEVDCRGISVIIKFDNHSVKYEPYVDDDDSEDGDDYNGTMVRRNDFEQIALDDLASTLKNPRLKLDEFSVNFDACDEEDIRTYYNNLQYALEPLNHQLSVKKVELDVLSPSNLLSILPFLKPEFLENISIRLDDETGEINWRIDPTEMDQVALLDQWKQAEKLKLQDCFDRFPLKYATHFKRFHIGDELESDKFNRIKNFLSELDNFEQCILFCWEFSDEPGEPDSVHELLGAPVSSNETEDVFHYSIPDSDYYLEFKTAKSFFEYEITRKKRESH